ncbi:MAG: single-stranded DNA-binding protein [Firmicutes bacterium]|nr:single-stranded DNA-binding protein [Bacillota bacterium]MBQ3111907.1 single-stranded DNA-binding protein [Bacillota bacterium]MBQ6842385.1 single-stranded DNA-binding protein [Bacillota bacterium]MBR6823919.1 single-stranded DNA-binding protein [Bacillota bacterium]MBR7113909.1 single-stranded DNA-binding protein [Bacillota bacterium]
MLNRVVLIGRLTRDPELRYTQSGVAVVNFTIAVDRPYKSASGERETDFIDIVVWRQLAENCEKYLAKGRLVAVDGRLQIRRYETSDGQKRNAAEVVADDVRFLTPREGSSPSGMPAAPAAAPDYSGFSQSRGDEMLGDDDLPF